MSADKSSGQMIGNYRIGTLINSGSFGTVYQAEHTILGRTVAIKVLHGVYLDSDQEREQFIREVRLLEELRGQPHVLPLLDVGFVEEGGIYIIVEYATKGSLRDLLQRQPGNLLPIERALALLEQIGQALDSAHQKNIIHRNLKPDNVLFIDENKALLADFGITVIFGAAGKNVTMNVTGTPSYMAPEQFQGLVNKRADQYSLGCIAYELLTGHRPFNAPDLISMRYSHENELPPPPTQYNPRISPELEAALLRALEKDRTKRYESIVAFVSALQKAAKPLASNTKEHWLAEGNTYYSHGDYQEALVVYEQAIGIDPRFALAYSRKGHTLSALGNPEEALIAYEQAIDLDSNIPSAYYGKGQALFTLERYHEALVAYERALRLDSNHIPAYYGKAEALSKLKRYPEALVAYEHIIHLDPKQVAAYYGKAGVLSNLKRLKEALVAYEQALRLDSNYIGAYYGKADILSNLKRYPEALVAYERVLDLDPKHVVAYRGKADVLFNLNRC